MEAEKNITIVKPGSGEGVDTEAYDIKIQQGVTCQQALQSVGVAGDCFLTKGDGNDTINPSDDLYPLVENGEKLFVTTSAEFGG